jgi:Ca2+-binding RTX toxin-like protein
MSTYNSYLPISPIGKAMFNFDAFGVGNYKLTGTIRVSTSDSFSYADYLSPGYSFFYAGLYTSSQYTSEFNWSSQRTANVQDILNIYKQFANISFVWQGDYDFAGTDTTVNPEDVGRANLSDINITWLYRPDVGFGGVSGASSDALIFGYTGGAGDIFLNSWAPGFGGDYSLDLNTRGRQTLMHELGHSLGLSHPHLAFNNGVPSISNDYAATVALGFQQLGFAIISPSDMYKEYFTIMSYDDQLSLLPGSNVVWHAHTPMILDVIALQEAYGEGPGTTGTGNDTISAGTAGYRTYFDKGGVDTIDMSSYTEGAYLNMGVSIVGAPHLVGVGMSAHDASNTILNGGDPAHLRWFYGEYENAKGSSWADLLVGNWMSNNIAGLEGDDWITGGDGNDSLDGGGGDDELEGGAGNDVFDWTGTERDGNDTMVGGPGDDVYVLNLPSDVVVESSFEGVDTVFVGSSYSLAGTALENLATFSDQQLGVVFTGNGWANVIGGGAGADALAGNDGADTLTGYGGNDTLSGGSGLDTAQYSGAKASYAVSKTSLGFVVSGPDGSDSLRDVERLSFSDVYVALDVDGTAGEAYRLYQAAFNRKPDISGLGYQINALDNGLTLSQVAQNFINSPEFRMTYGALNTSQFVTQLYANVLHRVPDSGGLAYHIARLESGVGRADVLVGFSESPENQAAVIGAIQNGMVYTL